MDGTSVMVQPSISRIPIPLLFIILAVALSSSGAPFALFPFFPSRAHRRDPKAAGSDEATLQV